MKRLLTSFWMLTIKADLVNISFGMNRLAEQFLIYWSFVPSLCRSQWEAHIHLSKERLVWVAHCDSQPTPRPSQEEMVARSFCTCFQHTKEQLSWLVCLHNRKFHIFDTFTCFFPSLLVIITCLNALLRSQCRVGSDVMLKPHEYCFNFLWQQQLKMQ